MLWNARGLGGLSNVNMGQWNRLQQMQVLQALQTLASLGVGQIAQQRNFLILAGQSLEHSGQGANSSMPKVGEM